MTTNVCTVATCDRPTHDGWYVCQTCGDELTERLTDFAWMLDQLDLVVSQQTRYAVTAGKVATGNDHPLPINLKASEQRAYLVASVTSAARMVVDENPAWKTDPFWLAVDNPSAPLPGPSSCAAWLEHRIAGLRLHAAGGQARDDIMRHWVACEWLVDRPPERRYLGECVTDWEGNDCGGRIYQRGGKPEARCDTCGGEYDADALREILLSEARTRLVTASEAALLSTYLGLSIGRTAVRKLVNQWTCRKVIEVRDHESENADPRVNFGDVMDRLARFESERDTA